METSSAKRDIIVDLSQVPWKQAREGNQSYEYRVCLEGGEDGPEAMQVRLPGMDVPPHFHHASQFQLLLKGSMQFSDRKMESLSVHYTDHDVPYGPFKPDSDHSMLILHAKPGGYSPMSDKEARKLINSRGRELEGCAREAKSEPLPGGGSSKTLLSNDAGVSVQLIECPAGASFAGKPAVYGQYQLVLSGSVTVDGKRLGPDALRFVQGDKSEAALVAGPEGATFIVLTYDSDASKAYGGKALDDVHTVPE
jgi:hypothetical protein